MGLTSLVNRNQAEVESSVKTLWVIHWESNQCHDPAVAVGHQTANKCYSCRQSLPARGNIRAISMALELHYLEVHRFRCVICQF